MGRGEPGQRDQPPRPREDYGNLCCRSRTPPPARHRPGGKRSAADDGEPSLRRRRTLNACRVVAQDPKACEEIVNRRDRRDRRDRGEEDARILGVLRGKTPHCFTRSLVLHTKAGPKTSHDSSSSFSFSSSGLLVAKSSISGRASSGESSSSVKERPVALSGMGPRGRSVSFFLVFGPPR